MRRAMDETMTDPALNPRDERPHRGLRRPAFTLLEVILALAVLAVSLAALGEVLRRGELNSRESSDLTQAQLIAASKFAELTSGALALNPVVDAPITEIVADPPWLYSIEMANTQEVNLLAVRVTVRQDLPENQRPVSYSVVRWMPNPLATSTTASGSTSTANNSTGSTSAGSTTGGTP